MLVHCTCSSATSRRGYHDHRTLILVAGRHRHQRVHPAAVHREQPDFAVRIPGPAGQSRERRDTKEGHRDFYEELWIEARCEACGEPFATLNEWEDRHMDEDNNDYHAACCPECLVDTEEQPQ